MANRNATADIDQMSLSELNALQAEATDQEASRAGPQDVSDPKAAEDARTKTIRRDLTAH